MNANRPFLKALLAFCALPGTVAFAVPVVLALAGTAHVRHLYAALALLGAGSALLGACVREFYVAGRGTLAPWAPPQRLVTTGPYRFSRNPMYIAVALIILAWWLLWGGGVLLAYALAVMGACHVRVVLAEEPWAQAHFGRQWQAYRARVPRWLIR
jgi:protein-S-isoprenylcysteine O-methyltransferase Ste14